MIWHDFDDPGWVDKPGDWWGHTGWVKEDNYRDRNTWTPKPVYQIVRMMSEKIGSTRYVGRFSGLQKSDFAFAFATEDSGQLIIVAWTTSPRSTLKFLEVGKPKAYTWRWQPVAMVGDGDHLRVHLTDQPCYVVVIPGAANETKTETEQEMVNGNETDD